MLYCHDVRLLGIHNYFVINPVQWHHLNIRFYLVSFKGIHLKQIQYDDEFTGGNGFLLYQIYSTTEYMKLQSV